MTTPFPLPTSQPSSSTSGASSDLPYSTAYEIWVQDKDRNLVGMVDAYDKATIIPRFNAVGAWALSIDANHPMAPYLKTPGYGILVNRFILDSTGVVVHADTPFFSGPMRKKGYEVQSGVKTRTFSGGDNLIYIAERDVWPVPGEAFDADVTSIPVYGYWKLNDTSGTTATDSSGNGRDGTYDGGFTLDTAIGSTLDDEDTCATFDGSSGYVDTGAIGVGDGGAWSNFLVHGWMRPNALPGAGAKRRICSNSSPGTTHKGFSIYLDDNAGMVTAFAGTGAGSSSVSSAAGAVAVGNWYYIALQYDTATIRLYINGVRVDSTAFSATVPADGSTHTFLGRSATASTEFFGGDLMKWAIHDGFIAETGFGSIQAFYSDERNRFAQDSEIAYDDLAENAIWDTVDVQCGPGALPSRQISGLAMGTNNHAGSTIHVTARFDNTIAKDGTGLLQTIARASSPELGFKCVQSGTALTFSVYTPADLTSNILLSEELGNLGDITYDVEAPDYEQDGNYVVIAGGGAATDRAFYLASDSTSIGDWTRAEAFVDKRDSSDANVLATEALSVLAQIKEKVSVSFQVLPTAGLIYGVDFGLGDKVTVVVDGDTITDIVREVQIDLDPASGEVVTIAAGTDGATARPSGNPSITGRFLGPKNADPKKHGKQAKKHLKGTHHAKHVKQQAKAHHASNHARQKLDRRT